MHHVTSEADLDSRRASLGLGLALPGDILLYLLLPMYAAQFGVTLAEAGLLLAANRLIRIVGYGWVTRFYSRHGDRLTCLLAVGGSVLCASGYGWASGFWMLLPLRLLWGLCFAALNLSTQALATAEPTGAARRSGHSRAFIALGPALALPLGALVAHWYGPRPIFFLLAAVALFGFLAVRNLPSRPHPIPLQRRRLKLPGSLDAWSFLEGLILDGLFILGLAYLGKELFPGGAVVVAGLLMMLRYLGEIVLSPLGGHMAERFGAERLLVVLSSLTCVVLVGFGAGLVWSCGASILILRSLQMPLLAPIVSRRTAGPGRVQALASRLIWRDIGAGAGPIIAGLLLPVVPPLWLYAIAAALLALVTFACASSWKTTP